MSSLGGKWWGDGLGLMGSESGTRPLWVELQEEGHLS